MKVIFLDIDGVLVNRSSLMAASGAWAKGQPSCVAALNEITDKTDAKIVISSTWRSCGLEMMQEFLADWGVKGEVIGCTPDLSWRTGQIYAATERGDEIQAWLDLRESAIGDVEAFVILDDDADMKHLLPHLVQTEFEPGLTMYDASRAISFLSTAAVEHGQPSTSERASISKDGEAQSAVLN
jgi:Swiss Army Knife RNA repair-like protein